MWPQPSPMCISCRGGVATPSKDLIHAETRFKQDHLRCPETAPPYG